MTMSQCALAVASSVAGLNGLTCPCRYPLATTAQAAQIAGAGDGGPGLLLIDLDLPELDLAKLREALGESEPAPESLEVVERRQIAAMLRHTSGNRRKAAQLLGLARSTLLAKIRRYGLESPVETEV